MSINNVFLIILIGLLISFISTPTVVALPPFSGVFEYSHSNEIGSVSAGTESALFGKNTPVTINLSHQNEPNIAINPLNLYNIVTGANDYRLGNVWTGYYFSNDGGNTWSEGLINRTGNLSFANAAGDPVLAFDGLGNAYYAGIAFNRTTNSSSIFVAKSIDGGATFRDPVILAYSPNSTVSLDKPWMAVNTTNNNIYVAWTEFYTSASINFTRSTDGGATWSSAIRVNDLSNNNNQFSQVAAGPNGEVYIAWEDFNVNRILIDKSTNNGQTFGSDIQVQFITPINGTLSNNSFKVHSSPTMAVDTSSGSNRGNIYIAWADNRTGDADILFTRSTNGGSSWSTPIRVNNDTSGNGKDQFFPAMSVDPNGKISVIFYDRRDDPSNHNINVYYAESTDGGLSFTINKKINDYPINSDIGFNGGFIGDYIGIASGSGIVHSIWMDTRNGNQDIYTTKALSDWQYNRTLTITGTTAGAQTNYQMKLTVYKGNGTDAPGVVYLGDNIRDDFGDLRFTKSDGVTLLDYWIESYSPGVSAVVWVEVDSIPISPGTASIYIYYGNPLAASASNGLYTFDFFDDFNGIVLDAKWTVRWGSSGNVAEKLQELYLTSDVSNTDTNVQSSAYTRTRPFAIDYSLTPTSGTGAWVAGLLYSGNTITSGYRLIYHNGVGYNLYVDNAPKGYQNGASDLSFNNAYNFTIALTNNTISIYRDGVQKGSWTNSLYQNIKVGLGRENWMQGHINNYRVRNYANPEPAWGA